MHAIHCSRNVSKQDNTFLVAVAGFTHDGDIELQEGGGSAWVCVSLEPEDLLIDERVYFIFSINDSTSGTGNGK